MYRYLIVLVALLLMPRALLAVAPAGNAGPAATVDGFYRANAQLKVQGLPNDEQLRVLTPYLSARLLSAMRAAKAQQQICIQKHPGDKPPLIEGDLFSSLFEGPTGFQVGVARVSGMRAQVPVHFRYDQAGTKDHPRWTDTVLLVREGKAKRLWRIDDLRYGGNWGFSHGTGALLSSMLTDPALCK
ncbi:DUF3828 domain-containing protein [Dyella psychrodurans]|uniref:DUF3828 domain-containing protein n=1 Tax=Dyella psychrodurans TaxID=1927960 RepID=A0A370XCS1_9GAMM|nr:DUF3828 domain-containing protein [Dyella psychrodurans]RDS86208.1 DUF3828 domain-containing protein [Dyella psychrodurans]